MDPPHQEPGKYEWLLAGHRRASAIAGLVLAISHVSHLWFPPTAPTHRAQGTTAQGKSPRACRMWPPEAGWGPPFRMALVLSLPGPHLLHLYDWGAGWIRRSQGPFVPSLPSQGYDPSSLPSVPTAAAAPATRSPGCLDRPRRRSPRTAWESAGGGGRRGRRVRPMGF